MSGIQIVPYLPWEIFNKKLFDRLAEILISNTIFKK